MVKRKQMKNLWRLWAKAIGEKEGTTDREADKISVVERINGERKYLEYPARYIGYYDDPKGKFKSILGTGVIAVLTFFLITK